jgi:hypothetical protein
VVRPRNNFLYLDAIHKSLFMSQATQIQETTNDSGKNPSVKEQSGGTATFQFQDNRSESSAIQQIKDYGDHNRNAKQLAQLKKFADSNSSTGTVQLKTNIRHTVGTLNVNGSDQTVGTNVYAKLDPRDPVVGSATGKNTPWMQWIRSQHKAANVVRGHLLNHDLGGFGIEENLYPISTKANSNHSSKVEQNVKGELSNLDGKVKGKDEAQIHYRVDVDQDATDTYKKAAFQCQWGVLDNSGFVKKGDETIDSDLAADKGGFGGGKKDQQSPKRWQHGKSKGGQEVKAVRERLIAAATGDNIKISFDKNVSLVTTDEDENTQDYMECLYDLIEELGIFGTYVYLSDFEKSSDKNVSATAKEMIRLLLSGGN